MYVPLDCIIDLILLLTVFKRATLLSPDQSRREASTLPCKAPRWVDTVLVQLLAPFELGHRCRRRCWYFVLIVWLGVDV
jgi:hypothetical protein